MLMNEAAHKRAGRPEKTGMAKEPDEKLAEERLDQLRYLQADFDNYRKRFEAEKQAIIRLASEAIVKEMLVVADEFEITLRHMESGREGVEMLYRNFMKVLERHGLRRIETAGKKFDPRYHEAVAKEASEKEEGTVLEEIGRGYILDSKVIRPARVKIAGRD